MSHRAVQRSASARAWCSGGLTRIATLAGRAGLLGLLGLAASLAAPGCGDANRPPSLQPVASQFAQVGTELVVELGAGDPDDDALTWVVESATLPDLLTRTFPARVLAFGRTGAYLRWTPVASDVGLHTFTVRVTDGAATAEQSFTVTVAAGSSAPIFREPLGEGSTLDLAQTTCTALRVLVEDADSPDVDLSLAEPIPAGATLDQDAAMGANFSWCPTQKQIDSAERYAINFVADDRGGHVVRKKYTIVLRRALSVSCPGQAPQIAHTAPVALETLLDLQLAATVTDDLGLSGPPLLYYSFLAPSDPANPDFGDFKQVALEPTSGDEYVGRVPNPVAGDTAGTTRTLYYFFEATDDDDATGTCDHRTRAPAADVYLLDVTRPASEGGVSDCAPCSADVQCDSGDCAAFEGAATDRCRPSSGTCSAPTCTDDTYEDNDTAGDPGVPVMTAGVYSALKICGDGSGPSDEDYYGLLLTDPTPLTATVSFSHSVGDIDLQLTDENDQVLMSSYGVGDQERVSSACLAAGLYFLRVFSFASSIDAAYSLDLQLPAGGCCTPDALEDDDDVTQALPVIASDLLDNRSICPGDEDWYQIDLTAGEKLVVDLLFDQNGVSEDIDLHLYDTDGTTNLTPCPPCDTQNGQSTTPDEHLEYTAPATGTYYVVVRGFAAASNDYYLIGFDVQ